MTDRIYLEKLIDKNVGPLSDISIKFPFHENGNPKPVILVGENGAGKTTVLSNIVDAFYEMAGKAFNNANQSDGRNGYQYFKTIITYEIHTGASFLYSYIAFSAKNNPKYVLKTGDISPNALKEQTGDSDRNISWAGIENVKISTADENTIKDLWAQNVLCYFGPDRYEKPAWMGDKYYQTEDYLHPIVKTSFDGMLNNPIEVKNVTPINLQWLLDVIADSRFDIEIIQKLIKSTAPEAEVNGILLLNKARSTLETILSKIIGESVYFQLNYRNRGAARFKIVKRNDESVVCPTLDSLSAGQIALFNMFATIVRYADNNDIKQSINLDEITGIVVIDEIELHLHSRLQKEVLPELIKLFPKIQFVISSHAPLFLLGMRDTFGEDGFDVYELPYARKIDVERFSEFSRAYDYVKETQQYQKEIKSIAESIPQGEKPLVITEGSTDWKHMKTAFEVLSAKEEYRQLFDGLDFDFLEYEPKNSDSDAPLKIEMGNKALVLLCEDIAKIPHERKYIIIADRDTPDDTKELVDKSKPFKKWDDNTYSAVLPLPESRADTPKICIEHYYSDAEIEKEIEINGIKRHLFMGKDFNAYGCNKALDRFCEKRNKCGSGKINIIDGTQGERVRNLSDDNDITNYAITKSDFVDYVTHHTDEFDFSNFIPLFELIKTIIGGTTHA